MDHMDPHAVLIYLLRLALAGMLSVFAFQSSRAHAALILRAVDAGTPLADDEYIQFENTGEAPIDLSRYSIQIKNTGATTIQKKNFTAGSVIGPKETYVAANKDGRYALQARMTYSSLTLSNDGGIVALVASTTLLASFDHPTVAALFEFTAHSKPQQNTPSQKALSAVPESISIINQPKLWDIHLSELLARPTTGDEFIEITNNATDAVDVAGLVLRDGAGVRYALGSRGENTLLGPREHRAWWRSRTRIALNDTDGELVQLIDPSGVIVDQINIEGDAVPDASFARTAGGWMWSTLSTPSHPNQYGAIPQPPVVRAIIPAGPHRVGEEIFFSATDTTDPNGDITTMRWDFGDGLSSYTATTTHRYQDAGDFSVRFIATDSANASSTVQRTITIISAPSSTVPTPTSSPPIIKSYAPPLATIKTITYGRNIPHGVITVPPHILGRRRFVVDDRIVETTTDRPELARLVRGTVVHYSARATTSGATHLHRITKHDALRIAAAQEPPPLTEITGDVLELRGASFVVAASNTDVLVAARARDGQNRVIKQADHVTVRGVFVQFSPDERALVPVSVHDIILHAPPPLRPQPLAGKHLLLLGGSGFILLLLHILFTHYAHRLYHPSDSGSWPSAPAHRARSAYRHAKNGLTHLAHRIVAGCSRLLGNHFHAHG